MKRLLAFAMLLTACGTTAPGFAIGADGGWVDLGTGVAAQGLVVKANGVDVGVILLDVDETTGVWKVFSERDGAVFYLDPHSGIVGSAFNSVNYVEPNCAGEAIVGNSSQCAAAEIGGGVRKLAVRGADIGRGLAGDRVLVADGASRVVRVASVMTRIRPGDPITCYNQPSPQDVCGSTALNTAAIPIRLTTPITLSR